MYTGIGTVQRHCGREGVEKWQWLVVCPDRTREGQPPASVHRDRDSSKTLWEGRCRKVAVVGGLPRQDKRGPASS